MPVTVKKITLWRKEVDNQAGMLAGTLEPLARAGADLHVVMGYRYPGNEAKAVIELHPLAGRKVTSAAQQVGLAASSIPRCWLRVITSRAWHTRSPRLWLKPASISVSCSPRCSANDLLRLSGSRRRPTLRRRLT